MQDNSFLDPNVIELQERTFQDTGTVTDPFQAPAGVLDISQGGTGAATATDARSNLGLGSMATKNIAAAVADTTVVAGVAYSQTDFQDVIDKLNELLGSLRAAQHIAP